MLRNRVDFHWQIQEQGWSDETPWSAWSGRVEERGRLPVAERKVLTAMARAAVLLGVLLLLVAATPRSPTYERYLRVTEEIRAMVAMEQWAIRHGDDELYTQLIADPQALAEFEGWLGLARVRTSQRSDIRQTLLHIQLHDAETVSAQVRIVAPSSHWISVPYRETFFYTRHGEGWQRTVPPDAFWGAAMNAESRHLTVDYYARDADLIAEVLDDVDQAYIRLNQFVPLAPGRGSAKLHFAIEPQLVTGWRFASMKLAVISPHLLQIPDGQPARAALYDAMLGRMIDRALSHALLVSELHQAPEWYVVLSGMSSWIRSALFDRPPDWQTAEVAQLGQLGRSTFPFFLSDVKGKSRLADDQWPMRQELAYTLVDYIAATYGMERVPDLLPAMLAYDTWEELIPAVFGESVRTFTRGWNVYLAEQYDFAGD